jgi:DNA-binding MarR family transcriptional regulator
MNDEPNINLLVSKLNNLLNKLLFDRVGNNITYTQFEVLNAINNSSEAYQSAINNVTGIDRSTCSEVVRRLLAHGYIAREDHKTDTRRYVLRLTALGKETLKNTTQHVKAVERAVCKDAHTQRALIVLLKELVDEHDKAKAA